MTTKEPSFVGNDYEPDLRGDSRDREFLGGRVLFWTAEERIRFVNLELALVTDVQPVEFIIQLFTLGFHLFFLSRVSVCCNADYGCQHEKEKEAFHGGSFLLGLSNRWRILTRSDSYFLIPLRYS